MSRRRRANDPPATEHGPRPRVVIIGAGFGGLSVVRHLAKAPVEITIVDQENYHGFWPLLYQVATAGLGADDISHPIRSIVSEHPNVMVRLGVVTKVDVDLRRVELADGAGLDYDYLVVAPGSASSDFNIAGVREHAFALKSVPDAVALRNHILETFERADSERDSVPDGQLTFVLAGGGPTGVELAGALSELIGTNLARDFRHLDVAQARVVLIEATDHLLSGFSPSSQNEALATLRTKGVEVMLGAKIASISGAGVVLADGSTILSETIVWTAGVQANQLVNSLPGEKRRNGTVVVGTDLAIPGYPEVFVIGDAAAAAARKGGELPQLAQVAIQGGKHAAKVIEARLAGRTTAAFHYHDHGIMATIGRRDAVAEIPGGLKFTGSIGWVAWLSVHLVFLIGFRNRAVVLLNWGWSYLTWDRASRTILDLGHRASSIESPPT